MRVIVLGAGLLGVTSAYYLQQLGHEVTVIDRHATPVAKARCGTADAGTAGIALPSPPHAGLRVLRHCLDAPWQRLKRAVAPQPDAGEHWARLSAYSRATVHALHGESGIASAVAAPRLLHLHTDREAFARAARRVRRAAVDGDAPLLLCADEAIHLEPALQAMHRHLHGAVLAADDTPGDVGHAIAAELVFLCRAAGVRFLMNRTVAALHEDGGRLHHVELRDAQGGREALRAHAYVMALGPDSLAHARTLGIRLPMRLLREYAVTMPVHDAARAPRIALRDHAGQLRVTRQKTADGDVLRLVRTVPAQAMPPAGADAAQFAAIVRRGQWLLPDAGDASQPQRRSTLLAIGTHGLPLIGRTRLPNLFLNTAPGALGWVNACGAGKSIARIVSGLRPEVAFAFTRA